MNRDAYPYEPDRMILDGGGIVGRRLKNLKLGPRIC